MKIEKIKEPITLQDEEINELGKHFKKIEKELQETYDKALGALKVKCCVSGANKVGKFI